MSCAATHELYRRWLDELWGGQAEAADTLVTADFIGHWPVYDVRGPVELAEKIAETRGMFSRLTFEVQVGPLIDGDLLAARWTGSGSTPEGTTKFFGNDILRIANGRFAEYWTASSSGA